MISTDVCRKQVVSEVRNYTEFPKLEKKWKLRESLDEASGEPAKFCYEVAKNFALVILMKIYKKQQNESWEYLGFLFLVLIVFLAEFLYRKLWQKNHAPCVALFL